MKHRCCNDVLVFKIIAIARRASLIVANRLLLMVVALRDVASLISD